MTAEKTMLSRIEALEKKNRQLRVTVLLLMLLTLFVITAGLAAPEERVIRAQQIQLVDGRDESRIILDATGTEGPRMAMFGPGGGMIQAGFGIVGSAPGILLHDDAGRARTVLSIKKEGPALLLNDTTGTVRAQLVATDEAPSLALYDSAKQALVTLGAPREAPGLSVRDANGRKRAAILAPLEGPSLLLLDPNGAALFSKP
jgi:hypothetical protein